LSLYIGCTIERLWKHLNQAFPDVVLDDGVKNFVIEWLLDSPLIEFHSLAKDVILFLLKQNIIFEKHQININII